MTKLVRLQKQYNIARVRKPPPREVAATLICEKIAEDLHHRQGPNTVKALLAIEGYQIPRYVRDFLLFVRYLHAIVQVRRP